jgi:uncharacterized RDD family membrane protein YckC
MTTEPTLPPADAFAPAGFWRRFCAHLVDAVVMSVFIPGGVGFCIGVAGHEPTEESLVLIQLLLLVLGMAYAVGMEYLFSATIGKLLLGIAVVGVYGERLTPGALVGRYFTKFVLLPLTLGTEALLAGRKSGLALHDSLSGTRVVRTHRVYG